MLQFEELKRGAGRAGSCLQDLGQALGLEKLREEVEMLEHKSAEPGFWDNMEQAQKITQRMAALKGKDEAYQKLQSRAGDCMASSRWATRPRTSRWWTRPKRRLNPLKTRLLHEAVHLAHRRVR